MFLLFKDQVGEKMGACGATAGSGTIDFTKNAVRCDIFKKKNRTEFSYSCDMNIDEFRKPTKGTGVLVVYK